MKKTIVAGGKNNKFHRILMLICVLGMTMVCTGCNKVEMYDIEQYRTEEDTSIYCFTERISDLQHIVATSQYDDEHILLYEELLDGNELHKKVWIFSYISGEKRLCSDLVVSVENNYQVTEDRFSIFSVTPLVISDIYANEIYLYTDDFSAYSVLTIGDFTMPESINVRGDKFYFMDVNSCKVYIHGLEEFRTGTKQVDYETFREESKLVYEPDINMTNCCLDGVSESGDEIRLYAESLLDNEYYYYIYNTQTEAYEEMYRFDDESDALWKSWEYEKTLVSVKPSAVARYEMIDYTENRTYTVKIEPSVVYSHVKCDLNISKEQDEILFYVVDENEERITEIFLWDYTKAESEPADTKPEKIRSEIPKEIDYADLTDKAELLENKYGIHIVMGENVICEFDAYEYEQVTDEERIYYALEQLELAMGAFPDGMCAEMTEDYALGFNVYLCGSFKPKNEENISDAGAFFTFDNGYYNVAMNIMQDNTEANLIHEMAHAIDDYFGFCGAAEQLEEDWQKCNPEGFEYLDSYFDYEEEFEYTYYDDFETINEVYFCDTYSKTFPGEDRSRVMEYFGSTCFEGDTILESDSLRKKARLLLDYCTEYLECFRMDEEYGLKSKAEASGW